MMKGKAEERNLNEVTEKHHRSQRKHSHSVTQIHQGETKIKGKIK